MLRFNEWASPVFAIIGDPAFREKVRQALSPYFKVRAFDGARMASIIDIFGALTYLRADRPGLAPQQALSVMGDMERELKRSMLKLFTELVLAELAAGAGQPPPL